jgi:hypothetical protein
MTRKERLRRVAILCCHCLRNLAYYKAGWHKNDLILKDQFWTNVNGNFLDISVLEWCKLFGDLHGKHYWGKIISEPQSFYAGMLHELKIKKPELETLRNEMQKYRDKFVAHLDSDKTMDIPSNLTLAQKSVEYLYAYIKTNEDEGKIFNDAPSNATVFYDQNLRDGKAVYNELRNVPF